MKTIRNFLRTTTTVIGIVAIVLSGIQPPHALAQGTDDGIERDYNAETGKVSHITVTQNTTLSVMRSMSSDMTTTERSDVLVERFAPEFGLSEPSEELIVKDESQPEADRVVTKYQQVFQGVPVLGGELIVNASEDGALLSMNGEVAQGLSLDTVPSLSAETAIAIAKQGMMKWYGGEAEDYQFADVSLWIFDESLLRTSSRPPELVWRMDMTPADQLQPIRELVLVNAKTGNVSLHFNQVDNAWHTAEASQQPQSSSTVQSNAPQSSPSLQTGTTWYVSTTGNDGNSCLAPPSPCATINGAIGKAINGDTIQVAIGTYIGGSTEVVWINRNVSLLGGWDPAFSSQTGYSTIDAQNIRRGVSVGATTSLDRFIITNGTINGDGGGIFSSGSAPLTITNSSINNNSASDGGGIYYSGSLIIENSSIYGNEASNLGGGIVVNLGSNLYLDNSTVAENTSNSNGAGMFIYGSATIRNSTIVYNTATNVGGGGISGIFGTSIILENSIVAQNTAPIYPDCNGSFITSQGNNIIGATVGTCWITPTSGDLLATNPIIGFNLIGTVPYYPLLEGSPAINAGNVNTCLVTDQRGVDRLGDASCDIGAYEFTLPGTVNTLFVLSGSGQSIQHDVLFPKSLYVVALDSQGTPVDGAIVSFTAPASGASAIFPKTGTNVTTAITNNEGIASSSIFRANNQSGSYNILGSSSGVPGSISFALTNTSGGKYVTTSGNDNNSCNSPALPCLTINAAITKATAGEAIYIASGIYSSNVQDPMFTIDKNLTFSGNWNATFTSQNGNTVIDGQNSRGLFKINAGINANIYSLTLQNGYANQGAGIYNQGNLTLKNVTIANNRTFNDGAGIYQNSGQLDLENVTISNNTAKSSGGGISVYDGTIIINSSTITQNFAAEPSGLAIGGGLSNHLNKSVTIKNTIIAGNSADTVPDCRGRFISLGNNLIGFADGCTLTEATGDQTGTNSPINVMLGNLAENGGGTLTHALLTGSPAIDAANLATCAATDQRGISRPQGTTCDIGAYEGSASQTISAVVRTYSASNSNALPGNLLCDQTDPTCTENANPNADRVHQYALGTYQLYLNEHNRNGIDQNNMPIISTVDYCSVSSCPYQNAFWTGGQAVFGNTFALADDVVAHELTHGVTQYESGLFYFYQSGAINESFSDMWGEFYDQTNGLGNDAANVKWLTGEDITGLGPLRSMSNPPQYGDPDMMTSALYNKIAPYEDFWDSGGVHSNSGINNKAVFLMVDGGTFNGKTVTALGWDKVIAIYYEAQTNLLSSGSDYSDLYYAVQQACTNLTGQHGITAADCVEVKDALDAVQMNSQPVAAFNPDAPLCSTGMVTGPALQIFQDNMESGPGNWAMNALWTLETGYASSSIYSLFGDDIHVDNLGETTIASPVVLPAGAFLHFKHAFGFEHYPGQNWDGGVLEYTKNGGTTWLDAGPLFSDGQNYKGVIYNHPLSSNVLKGRTAFVGDSHGYVSSRYNLSSLAGQTVQFRWRFATDQSFSYLGWYLDDIRIYTCTGAPATPIPTAPAINALVTDYTPLLDWPDAASTHHYEVQIATDAVFASLLYNDTNVPTSQYQVPLDLASDTTFYWRVRSVNGVGTLSNWSTVSHFRTALLPPVLVSPFQNEHILIYRPTFNWDDVPNATGYTIQISTTNTFAAPIVGNPILSTFTPATDLPKGLLYWRVQTKGTNGPSAWSEVRSYNGLNPPPAPVLTVPALNVLVTDYTPTFTWNNLVMPANTTLLKYQIQADDDPAFGSPAFEADSVVNNHTPAVDLPANTKYYWRVRAVNTLDEIGNWSIVSNFRTALTLPVLVTPVDLFDAVDLRTPFNWDDVPGATGYTLQVSTVTTFASFALNVATVPSNYTPVANLPAGVPLYWRVIANGLNGPSAPSAYRTITSTNPPSVPLLSLPALNALTTDYTPTLKWTIVTLPLGTSFGRYQVQVDDDPAFASPAVDDSSITSAALIQLDSPASLAPNTKFYWRVRAFNSVDETNGWSIVSNFRTALTPPVLVTPVDLFDAVDLRTPFNWDDVPGATGYTLQVSTVTTFASFALNVATVPSNYTPVANLPAGVPLYWRVIANGLNGPSAPSAYRTITSTNPPSVPLLSLPALNALTTDYTPTLKWTIVTLPLGTSFGRYQVQVDDDPAFASPAVDDSSITSAALIQLDSPASLAPNTKFYWRVRAFNSVDETNGWSIVSNFRTALTPPVLVTPVDLFDAVDLRTPFNWDDVPGATGYTLQVSTVTTFASFALNVATVPSNYTPVANLPAGVPLYWRVIANGLNGPSAPSAYRTITSTNPPSVPLLSLPALNALTTDYTPTLKWTIVTLPLGTSFGRYQVQVDDDPAFASPAVDDSSITSAALIQLDSPASLAPNTKFYWRVRAFNSVDETNGWSIVSNFRTALTPPVLVTPVDLFDAVDLRTPFNWDDVPGATGYTLQVSTVTTFASFALNVATVPSNYTPVANLPAGVPLYWRVIANGLNGPSAPSAYRTITSTNPPSVPLLSLPALNALTTDYTPTLKWTIVTLPLGTSFGRYQVQVDDDPAFASPAVDDSSITSAALIQLDSPASLAPNTKFYWRVRAFNSVDETNGWSIVSNFRTALTPPVLVTPVDLFDAVDLRTPFNWDDVPGATGYTLQVSTVTTFASFALNVATVPSNYTPVANLPAGVPLYWRVIANGLNGPSAPSAYRTITSTNPPSVPLLSLPALNALTTDYTPTLKWTIVTLPLGTSFGRYQVQVDDDPAFASPAVDDSSITSAALIQLDSPASLAPNTKFYWRVRAFNSVDETNGWSIVSNFRTALTPPVLVTPVDLFDAVDLRTPFNWDDVPGATGYTLQVSTVTTFASFALNVATVPSNYTPVANLPAGVPLYWRVIANGLNGPSAPSAYRTITSTNPPSVPLLSLPALNALTTDYTPTLKWTIVTLPLGTSFGRYQVQVDDDPAFASPAVDDSSITSAALIQLDSPASLAPNTKFYWRVRAFNSVDETNGWSVVSNFRTAITPPVLVTPVDLFDAVDLRPPFNWDDVPGATGYTLQVSTVTTFASFALNVATVPSNYTPVANLPAGVPLYWRVIANGLNGPSAPSAYRTITSTNPPSVPLLSLPALNALTTDYTPTLKWTIVTLPLGTSFGRYQVQVDDDPAFASPAVDDSSITSAALIQLDSPASLAPNTKFYWRVRAFNSVDETNGWSIVSNFRTALTPPVLVTPVDLFDAVDLRTPFNWDDVPGATGYTLQVSTVTTFASFALNVATVPSNYTPVANLPAGVPLYWRVIANGLNGPSAPSAYRTITSTNPPSVPLLSLPALNALTTDYTPTLKWTIVTLPLGTSFGRYQVQVDDDPAFASPAVDDSSITSAALIQLDSPASLAPNTKFYWRVRAFNSVDETNGWSIVSNFRTALTPPVLVTPVDLFDAVDLRTPFNWDDVPGATGYTLQVSTVTTFASFALNVATVPSNYTPVANLPAGVPLYWRVIANGLNGPSAPSAYRTITSTNPPSVPLLSLPALNALTTDYTPTLKWTIVTLPLGTSFGRYQVQVDDDPAFASPAVDDSSITSAALIQLDSPASLAPNTKFYWRVRAFNSVDETNGWSIVSNFRTALTPPVLVTPVDLFDAVDLRTPFNWDDVPGATGYTLQVSTVTTFASFALNVATVPSNYTPVANLPAGVPLYWRVIANGLNGPSAPSAYRTITSTNPPSVPLLSLPALNALTTDYTPTLKWTIVTLPLGTSFGRYQVQVDDDPAFASPAVDDSSITSAALIQLDSPASLAPNTKFYWRVRAFNSVDETNGWSIVSNFRTALTPPVLSLPANATAVITLTPIFDWSDVPTATGYQIQASTSSTFATTLVNAMTVSSTYTPVVALPSGYVIFWRVRSNGANGPSDWTTIILFTTP